jgi:hypothetical protein
MNDQLQIPQVIDLRSLVQLLNRHHRALVERLDKLEGRRGAPAISNPNFQGTRLSGVARSKNRDDALTRGELQDLIGDLTSSVLEAQVPIVPAQGIRVPELGREPSGIVTVRRLKAEIANVTTMLVGGDLTGNLPNPQLTNTGVVPGTYGDGTHVGQFTVDAKGRLTFAQNVPIAGSISGADVADEEPAHLIDTTSVTLTQPFLATTTKAWLNGVKLRRVASSPGPGEYVENTGTNSLDLGFTLFTTNVLVVDYKVTGAPSGTDFDEEPAHAAPTTTVTLSLTPTLVRVYVDGLRLRQVAPGSELANEFSITGAVLTFGFTLQPTNYLFVDGKF